MLDRRPLMGVALDAQPGHQPDAVLVRLDQGVPRATAHRRHDSVHQTASVVIRPIAWPSPYCLVASTSRPSAICNAASRTAVRSPGKIRCSVLGAAPRCASPKWTRPTGFSALPPPGPATPVIDTARSIGARASAPSAIAVAVSALTAPCAAITSGGTPSNSDFASFE